MSTGKSRVITTLLPGVYAQIRNLNSLLLWLLFLVTESVRQDESYYAAVILSALSASDIALTRSVGDQIPGPRNGSNRFSGNGNPFSKQAQYIVTSSPWSVFSHLLNASWRELIGQGRASRQFDIRTRVLD